MNDQYLPLTATDDSPQLLKGCLWALATAATLVIFVQIMWLGILRNGLAAEKRDRIMAETERDTAIREGNAAIQSLNERLGKALMAKADAENKAQLAVDAKNKAEAQRDQDERMLASLNAGRAVPVGAASPQGTTEPEPQSVQLVSAAPEAQTVSSPSSSDVVNFIRNHLARMMGPAESQLADYASEVDFHDKPYASLQAIATDRERWAQKWPRRIIQMSGGMPEVVFSKDASYGWQATVAFDWQWFFQSRSGAAVRGVYRDTWKIVPTAQGMKIISEHSVDAATGRSRD
jgi:hypothetical protein